MFGKKEFFADVYSALKTVCREDPREHQSGGRGVMILKTDRFKK
jgi:hypothetical protein